MNGARLYFCLGTNSSGHTWLERQIENKKGIKRGCRIQTLSHSFLLFSCE
jgi:hypothetical protein